MDRTYVIEFAAHGEAYHACEACTTHACKMDAGAAAWFEPAAPRECQLQYTMCDIPGLTDYCA